MLSMIVKTMAVNSQYTDVVRKVSCLRGIATLTGLGLAVEIGDWSWFTHAGEVVGRTSPARFTQRGH